MRETISHISSVIRDNNCNAVLLAGDLNSDFMRNSDHCNTVRDFLGDVSLSVSWETFDVDFTAVHERAGHTFTSTIDHFAWSQKVNSAVLDAGVLHLPDNESDHCPIYCTLNLSVNESVKTKEKIFYSKTIMEKGYFGG